MNLSHTLEIRWFLDNPLHPLVRWDDWQSPRTDFYAPIDDARSSVKVRGDMTQLRLEMKHLVSNLGKFELRAKHSVAIEKSQSEQTIELASNHWLNVTKHRCIKCFNQDTDNVWRKATCESGTNFIQVEWAKVGFNDRSKYTFCLEAPVDNLNECGQTRTSIDSLLKQLTQSKGLNDLAQTATASYPRWLASRMGCCIS